MTSIGYDVEALDKWFLKSDNRGTLYHFVYGIIGGSTGSHIMPEDLVQETYYRAERAISGRYKNQEFGEVLIFTIARNLALSELRRRKGWQKVPIAEDIRISAGPMAGPMKIHMYLKAI